MVQTTSRHAQLTAAMPQPVSRVGMACPRWSAEEEKTMRERYHADGAPALAVRFGRSPGSVRTKACAMGICGKLRPAARTAKAVGLATESAEVVVVTSSVATPVLNARVSGKAKKDAQPSAIAKMLEQMRALPAGHPRRLAYMLAARNGNGQDAYQAWLNWKPQAA